MDVIRTINANGVIYLGTCRNIHMRVMGTRALLVKLHSCEDFSQTTPSTFKRRLKTFIFFIILIKVGLVAGPKG